MPITMRVGEAALRQLRRLSLHIESRVQHKEYNAGNLKLLYGFSTRNLTLIGPYAKEIVYYSTSV